MFNVTPTCFSRPKTDSARRIYEFVCDDGLLVKRVVKLDGQWLARSDNDDRHAFPDFAFQEDQTLIGRAVWMGAKL